MLLSLGGEPGHFSIDFEADVVEVDVALFEADLFLLGGVVTKKLKWIKTFGHNS